MHQNKKNDHSSKGVIVKESYSQNLASTIMNAAKMQKLIVVRYYSNEKGITERIVEPMGLVIRMGRKNLVGWCRLRNDWRTFRIDRINFISILMKEDFDPRPDYNRADFEDEGVQYQHREQPERTERNDRTSTSRPNKEFAFNTDNIKTMSENKLDFSNENVKEYSEDEDDLAL